VITRSDDPRRAEWSADSYATREAALAAGQEARERHQQRYASKKAGQRFVTNVAGQHFANEVRLGVVRKHIAEWYGENQNSTPLEQEAALYVIIASQDAEGAIEDLRQHPLTYGPRERSLLDLWMASKPSVRGKPLQMVRPQLSQDQNVLTRPTVLKRMSFGSAMIIRVFSALLQDGRELRTATDASGIQNGGRVANLAIFAGIWTHSSRRLLVNA
jgi:hypothetical protein